MNTMRRAEAKMGEFRQFNAEVFEQVFGLEVADIELTDGRAPGAEDERVVASLTFSGERVGRMWLAVREGEVPAIVDHLLAHYQIPVRMDDSAVFAEMLNMFAANIFIRLSIRLRAFVTPPDTQWPDFATYRAARRFAAVLTARGGQTFTFYYAL